MKIKLEQNSLTVTREPGDPKFYNGGQEYMGQRGIPAAAPYQESPYRGGA